MSAASEFLDAILPEFTARFVPLFGAPYVEGFIKRNRAAMEAMLQPLVEALAPPEEDEEEDPDAVTPEKDALVMAAFDRLVEERLALVGGKSRDGDAETLPWFGRGKKSDPTHAQESWLSRKPTAQAYITSLPPGLEHL